MSGPEPEKMEVNLPAVGGRMIDCSLSDLKRRAKIYIAEEQNKIAPDNGLIALLCDTVRLAREQEDYMTGKLDALKEKIKS